MSIDNDNYSIAGRYRTVRKHLDDLGYRQALSLDSLPLIELLLVDLAQTKETLKHFQSIAKDNIETYNKLQLTVDPYKCDNAKLVQECNQAHLELLEAKETIVKQSNDYKKQIRKLENELNDLQLSFSKNLERIKQLETESSNKSKKISELLGKCCKPVINSTNLATKKRPAYPLRRPVLEADPLPKPSGPSVTFSKRNVEPYIVDFVSMADRRISTLTSEVTKLKEELFLSNEHMQTLKLQLNSKDKEICRLRKLLEGGRPCSTISRDHCALRASKRCPDSEENVCLQDTKLELEQQLREALNKQHEAMSRAIKLAERNEELEKELRDVDRHALSVETDCSYTVKENKKRVCRLQEKLDDVMTQMQVLQKELTIQRREAQELRADLEACKMEKNSVQRKLDTTLEEKKHMTDRINSLTMMGPKDLTVEICKLRQEKICELEEKKMNFEKKKRCNESNEKAQSKSLEQKNIKVCNTKLGKKEQIAETNNQKKITKRPMLASKSPDRVFNQEQSSNKKVCSCNKESKTDASQSKIDKIVHDKNVIIESLQNTIERLESERDHYKSEFTKIKDKFKKDFEKDSESLWSQICELREQMSEKEHAISKLLREKTELCREKFNLESKLHAQQLTPSTHHCPCRMSPSSERRSLSLSNRVERLERERDDARADVERLMAERDSLRERLKLATEAHVSEQRRLRDSLDKAELRLAHTERERRELFITQEGRRAAMSGLDDQLEDVREELRRTKLELSEQRTQYYQLRTLQDQTDQALGDVQTQLSDCENELSAALDRNKNLEQQQLQLDNQIKELRQEINTHRSRMAQMDREKDQLLMDLDEKTEKIAALEREISFKEQQASNMEQQIRDLSHTKQVCVDQTTDMERQMRSMQLELDNLHRQLSSASLDRESAIQENRRLQDELAAMSCEVRQMHKELELARAESHDLKRQLQTYVSEVRRAEDLLAQKENERTEMLNHFRSLSLEASVLENNNHSLETEAAEARGALQSARDQVADLERQLSNKNCLIRGYEAQITELTQNVASLEMQLQTATDQRLRAEDDLRTVRDLCMTLEQQKECISHRLEENVELKTHYELQLSRYRQEQEVFQDQMNKDHKTIDHLEKLLEDSRKETANAQANARELQSEIMRLKQKICDLQNKLSSETAEVRKYQNQASEYGKQIADLRRQITNERYERARIRESRRIQDENRRYGTALVPTTRQLQSSKLPCATCACVSNTKQPAKNKVQIREITSSTDIVDEENDNCYTNDFQQTFSRVCFCKGKAQLEDVIVNEKALKNIRNESLNDVTKKSVMPYYPVEDASQCARCGGKPKKQTQQCVYGLSSASSFMAETLTLMKKLLEERNKRSRCADDRYNRTEIPGTVVKMSDDKDEDVKTQQQQTAKCSIQTSDNSICSVSTQTFNEIVTVSDASQPHLLKILADIEQYAKNIQDQFQMIAESLNQSNYNGLINHLNDSRRHALVDTHPAIEEVKKRSLIVGKKEIEDKTEYEEVENNGRIESYQSLPVEAMSEISFKSDVIDEQDKPEMPYTSTPRQSVDLQFVEFAEQMDASSNQEDGQSGEEDLQDEKSDKSPEPTLVQNEPESENLPSKQRVSSALTGLKDDSDSTKYLKLPGKFAPDEHTNDNENDSVVENESPIQDLSGVAIVGGSLPNYYTLPEEPQTNEDIASIQEKIEQLRKDMLMDAQNESKESQD